MSTVFKLTAILLLMLGVITSIVTRAELDKQGVQQGPAASAIVGGILWSILSARAISVFAYVLDLLIAIGWNTHRRR